MNAEERKLRTCLLAAYREVTGCALREIDDAAKAVIDAIVQDNRMHDAARDLLTWHRVIGNAIMRIAGK